MNEIYDCQFIQLITGGDPGMADDKLKSAYIEFRNILPAITDSGEDYPVIFRTLSELYSILSFTPAGKKKGHIIHLY